VKHKIVMLFMAALVVTMLVVAGCRPAGQVTWNSGTSNEGSGGYVANLGIARLVSKYMTGLNYVSVPTGGSTQSVNLFGTGSGEIDACYPANVSLYKAYRKIAPHADVKWLPYQWLYFLSGDQMLVVKKDNTTIKSWSDLAGKKFYGSARGMTSFDIYQDVFTHMGIWDKMDVKEVAQSEVGDALSMGIVDAVGVSGLSLNTLLPWGKDMETRVDIKVINPTPAEEKVISEVKGLSPNWNVKLSAFAKDPGVSKVFSVSALWGPALAPYLDADLAYQVLKVLDEHTDEWFELAPGVGLVVDNTLAGAMVLGINSNPDIPVHPSTAKFLKEKGLWQNEWKIGEKIELSAAGMQKEWDLYGLVGK
jgi:TRAP-type uncharacterized transport system substrate-binding protein